MQLPKIDVQRDSLAAILMNMKSGALQVPRFQRDFVWPITKTRALLDSMYKEFPIGTFFFWRAPEGIPPLSRPLDELGIPGPQAGAKVSYILDGQQRLSSLYCAVNGIRFGARNYGRICIDLEAATRYDACKDEDFNDDIFVYRTGDRKQFISVQDLVSPNTLLLFESVPQEWKPAFNKIYNLFQTYPFSTVWIQEQTLADAIVIFQRINQSGQPLSRFDLVCANIWRADFDFRKLVGDVNRQLERRSFGQIEKTIFTQAFALILTDQCTTLSELSLETDPVKEKWPSVIRALELALDFAVNNLGVKKVEFLPYRGQLVVLAYYFYHRGTGPISVKEREMLWNWFWQVTLSGRYSSTSPTKMAEDAKKMRSFMAGEAITFNFLSAVTIDEILRTKMGSTSSALRNAVLCMLALRQPRNFKDNSPVNLSDPFFSNLKQAERHHIYPVGYLKAHGIDPNRVNLLANFCFIPADLNKEIGSRPPAEYLVQYRDENPAFETAIGTHLIPIGSDSPAWKVDISAFEGFLAARARVLADELGNLVQSGPADLQPTAQETAVVPEVDLLEIRIRDFIDERLTAVVGDTYWKSAIPGDVIASVKEKIDGHISRQPYLDQSDFKSGRSRLDFCDVSDYEKIFMKNWSIFVDHFQRKPELSKHMAAFRELRNCVQHNRKPTKVEEKNGEAAILWLRGILDKYDTMLASASAENGDTISDDEQN
jgi:hypothetical protein